MYREERWKEEGRVIGSLLGGVLRGRLGRCTSIYWQSGWVRPAITLTVQTMKASSSECVACQSVKQVLWQLALCGRRIGLAQRVRPAMQGTTGLGLCRVDSYGRGRRKGKALSETCASCENGRREMETER